MNFEPTEDQKRIRDTVREFAKTQIAPSRRGMQARGGTRDRAQREHVVIAW